MKNKIFRYTRILFWNFMRFLLSPFVKMDENLMLFGTAFEKFTDNPKYLYLYVLKNEKKFRPVWITDNKDLMNELKSKGFAVVKRNSLKGFILVMKAKFFFFSHNITDIFYFKRKNTVAINLWHGSPLKKIGFDSNVELKWIERKKKFHLRLPYETWDYFVVASEFWIPIFESALKIKKDRFLPFGLPKNDLLWEVKKNIDTKLHIKRSIFNLYDIGDVNKRVILYAPTFRDSSQLSRRFYKQLELFIKEMSKFLRTHNEFLLFLRLHPMDSIKMNIMNNSLIINVSNYPDMQELLAITDILITDYSSSIFDFTIMEKPIILYQFDKEEYKKERGGFYDIDLSEFAIIVKDMKQLLEILLKVKEKNMALKRKFNKITELNKCCKASKKIMRYLRYNNV